MTLHRPGRHRHPRRRAGRRAPSRCPVAVIDPTVATEDDLGGDLAPAPPVPVPDTEAPLEAEGDTASTTTAPSSTASSTTTTTAGA